MKDYKILIKGKMFFGTNTVAIRSPFDNYLIGTIPIVPKDEINSIVNAANLAYERWKLTNWKNRIKYIENFKEELLNEKDKICRIMSLEIAKPLKLCYLEFEKSIIFINSIIKEYKYLYLSRNQQDSKSETDNKLNKSYWEPVGVILVESTFDYPLFSSIYNIVPPLLTGNTIIFKPSLQGSIIGSIIGELFYKIKLPSSVINIIIGDNDILRDLINSNYISKRILLNNKKYNNEQFNEISINKNIKDSAIIFKDADIKKTVDEIINNIFQFSGQRLLSIKLVFVEEEIADKIISILKEKISNLSIGCPFDDVEITPLINKESVTNAKDLINDALSKKAKRISGDVIDKNILFPTLLDKVKPNMKIFSENQFAPILPVVRFNSIDNLIKMFSISKRHIRTSIFTSNMNLINDILEKLDIELITINKTPTIFPDDDAYGYVDYLNYCKNPFEHLLKKTIISKYILWNKK